MDRFRKLRGGDARLQGETIKAAIVDGITLDDVVVLLQEPGVRVITPEVVQLLRDQGVAQDVIDYALKLSKRPPAGSSRDGSPAPAA